MAKAHDEEGLKTNSGLAPQGAVGRPLDSWEQMCSEWHQQYKNARNTVKTMFYKFLPFFLKEPVIKFNSAGRKLDTF